MGLVFNFPLNFALLDAGPIDQLSDPSAVRMAFEPGWVAWNWVRTVTFTAAFVALAWAWRPTGGHASHTLGDRRRARITGERLG